MTQELVYTSSPSGLKAGSRGFCTVVSTRGMAANLAERLEALSGYRHIFATQDAQAALNPVMHSYLRFNIGGRVHYVLSRVSAAGLDYTQRSNKFAHHVVLDASELPAGGPAWLLMRPDFMESSWDGIPKILPMGRQVPQGDQKPTVCKEWQRVTGDAGWGGVLAETAVEAPRRLVTILFKAGTDPLPLMAESLALLQPMQRWEVTFCTYFTKLPPGVQCNWRCVLHGSPEAAALARLPNHLVIDLSTSLTRPIGGSLVETARTGLISRGVTAPGRGAPIQAVKAKRASAAAYPSAASPLGPSRTDSNQPVLGVGPPSLPVLPSGNSDELTALPPTQEFGLPRRKWPVVLAALAVLVLTTTAGGVAAILAIKSNIEQVETGEAGVADDDGAVEATDIPADQDLVSNDEGLAGSSTKEHVAVTSIPAKQKDNPPSDDNIASQAPEPVAPQLPTVDLFRELRQRISRVDIPQYVPTPVADAYPVKVLISDFPRGAAPDLELRLLGGEQAFGKSSKCTLLKENGSDTEAVWTCYLESSGMESQAVARIQLHSNELVFQWRKNSLDLNQVNLLRNCFLEIGTTGIVPVRLGLRTPVLAKAMRLTAIENTRSRTTQVLDIPYLPHTTNFIIDIAEFPDTSPPIKVYSPPSTKIAEDKTNICRVQIGTSSKVNFTASVRQGDAKRLEVVVVYDGVILNPTDWPELSTSGAPNGLFTIKPGHIATRINKLKAFLDGDSAKKNIGAYQLLNQLDQQMADLSSGGRSFELREKREHIQQSIRQVEKHISDSKALNSLLNGLIKDGQLHFDVWCPLDGQKLVLATSMAGLVDRPKEPVE